MKLLDLFCGAGGAGMGYLWAGYDQITGVDIKPQPNYPFEFVQSDAISYLKRNYFRYDLIHASPPCQLFSNVTPKQSKKNHIDLLNPTFRLITDVSV